MVKSVNKGRWTVEEHNRFINAKKQGIKWEEIALIVCTRSADQCRSHNQKMKLAKNKSSMGKIMVDKETQYEEQVVLYASRPVYTKENDSDQSPYTRESNSYSNCDKEDNSGDFEFIIDHDILDCDLFTRDS